MKIFVWFFGWYGAAAILGTYGLASFSVITSTSFWYQFFNFTGAIGIAIVSFTKKAYQPAALNTAWAVVAAIALTKLLFWS
ncbi:MAG: hypothetical protein Q7S09_02195 [bacterium]|nr:hypothetical protein [bacterium]